MCGAVAHNYCFKNVSDERKNIYGTLNYVNIANGYLPSHRFSKVFVATFFLLLECKFKMKKLKLYHKKTKLVISAFQALRDQLKAWGFSFCKKSDYK